MSNAHLVMKILYWFILNATSNVPDGELEAQLNAFLKAIFKYAKKGIETSNIRWGQSGNSPTLQSTNSWFFDSTEFQVRPNYNYTVTWVEDIRGSWNWWSLTPFERSGFVQIHRLRVEAQLNIFRLGDVIPSVVNTNLDWITSNDEYHRAVQIMTGHEYLISYANYDTLWILMSSVNYKKSWILMSNANYEKSWILISSVNYKKSWILMSMDVLKINDDDECKIMRSHEY